MTDSKTITCPKYPNCKPIEDSTLRDRDITDEQYQDSVRKVCAGCKEREE